MRRWVLCVLCLLFLPRTGLAEEQWSQFHCLMTARLEQTGSLEEPLDRWAREFVALVQPEIHWVSWPEGQSVLIEIWMADSYAFSVELLCEGGRVALQSELVSDDWRLLEGDIARSAQAFVHMLGTRLAPELDWPYADNTRLISPQNAALFLRNTSHILERWASQAVEPARDHTQTAALLAQYAAEFAESLPPSAPLLSVFIHYQPPSLTPSSIDPQWPVAQEALPASLISEIPMVMLETLAELASTELEEVEAAF